MSLQEIIKKKHYTIGVWTETESLEELLSMNPNISVSHLKSYKRKKEYLTIRLLLHKLIPNTKLSYNKYGGPQINTRKKISISHSKGLSAIIISDQSVGIDIEKISKQTLKLSDKFILDNRHTPLTIEKTTLIWCCKEAIYKLHVTGNIDFKDILLEPFTVQHEGVIQAKFKDITYSLTYKRINNHFLVYVCK